MIFIPIGLAATAVVLFLIGRAQSRKAGDMASVETSRAADLVREAADVAGEIGSGSFARAAEVKGVVECDSPLRSEISGTECVWYKSVVKREYEETYTERDSDGRTRTGTRRGSEIVSSNERRTPFRLRDESGAVDVDPEGATMEGERVASRFEQGDRGPSLSFGKFSVSLSALGPGRRTLGYNLEEWAVALGKRLYVLGEASDSGGRLRVGKPGAKGGRFIISLKSEEELTRSARTGSTVLSVVAGVLAAGAAVVAVLLVLGIL